MWTQLVNTVLGIWLMIVPTFLNYGTDLSNNSYIIGPLIITFSIIAYWEATRSVGKWNLPLGLWLVVYFIFFDAPGTIALIHNIGMGVIIAICSGMQGKKNENYGGGWKALWQKNPPHLKYNDSEQN